MKRELADFQPGSSSSETSIGLYSPISDSWEIFEIPVWLGGTLQGTHEPLISPDLFEAVRNSLRKNSGRSENLSRGASRQYLLKGLIRCAYCGMPVHAQTLKNGKQYYREKKGPRSDAECPIRSGSIRCEIADEQIGRIVEAIKLGPDWLEQVVPASVWKTSQSASGRSVNV